MGRILAIVVMILGLAIGAMAGLEQATLGVANLRVHQAAEKVQDAETSALLADAKKHLEVSYNLAVAAVLGAVGVVVLAGTLAGRKSG